MNTFFTADTHFDHKNIIKYDDRPFETIEEMNEHIIGQWNRVVAKKDVVYHLGDFAFTSKPERIDYFLGRLNGKIHLIKGGHDNLRALKKVTKFASISDTKILKNFASRIVLFHYPILNWEGKHYGAWHLHGHCHKNLKSYHSRAIDVCIKYYSYFPLSYEAVRTIIYLNEGNKANDYKRKI